MEKKITDSGKTQQFTVTKHSTTTTNHNFSQATQNQSTQQ